MSESPTTLKEIESLPFLRERFGAMADAILHEPDDTVLWIGAGLSAKYGDLPTWSQFLKHLLRQHIPRANPDFKLIQGLINTGRLSIAAECLQDLIGIELLGNLVQTFGTPSRRLPEQFGYFCVRDVITTNYDTLLEQVLPWYKIVSPSDGMENLISNEFKIVKIHGSVSNPQSCVLSLSTYVRAYNVNLHWYLTNILSSCTVVFLGSSMNPSEPYFRLLRLLRTNSRTRRRHFAIMAVPNSESGRHEGRRLQEFGIELIPYIPDENHSLIDEVISYIDSKRGSSKAVQLRLKTIRRHLDAGRYFHAAIYLWHTCHADVKHRSDRRAIGDTVSEFFARALGTSPASVDLVKRCESFRIDFAQLWQRTADLLVPSVKSVNGLRQSLNYIQAATGGQYPYLARRVTELEEQIAYMTNHQRVGGLEHSE